jgi:hypothetical protein
MFSLAASATALPLCLRSRLLSLLHDVTRSFFPLPFSSPSPSHSPLLTSASSSSSPQQPRPARVDIIPFISHSPSTSLSPLSDSLGS